MKQIQSLTKVLFAALLTAGLAACSSDSDNGVQAPQGERHLVLSINTHGVMRATAITDDPGATAENAFTGLTIGIFNSSGDAVKIQEFTSSSAEWTATATGVDVTLITQGLQEGDKVMVAANVPSGTFGGCTTMAEFKDKAIAIDDALANGTAEKTTSFPMLGSAAITATSGTTNFKAEVTLYHLVAKVTLDAVSIDFNGNTLYPNATFTPTEIFLYNVPEQKKFWFAPDAAGITNYYSGESTATTTKKEYLGTGTTTIATSGTPIAFDSKYYFYTLPNADTGDHASKLVIKGTFKATPSATGSTVYYPIYLDYNAPATAGAAGTAATGDQPGYKDDISLTARTPKVVYPNDNYKIGVTIKSIGATSPDSDLDPQQVTVSVTVADWTELTQTTTFN